MAWTEPYQTTFGQYQTPRQQNPAASLVQIETMTQYPVRSHFVEWDQKANSWTEDQLELTQPSVYRDYAPDEYIVEPMELPEDNLLQIRRIYE